MSSSQTLIRTGASITVVAEVVRLRSELSRVRLPRTVISSPLLSLSRSATVVPGLVVLLLLSCGSTVLWGTDTDSGDACRQHTRHLRAGWPQCVAPWARTSFGGHESGYYVGGGAPFHGDARCWEEGTWGWDYNGRLFDKRIWLGWHHGRRAQGGVGAYRTDGPRCVK